MASFLRFLTVFYSVGLLYLIFRHEKSATTEIYAALLLICTIAFMDAYSEALQSIPLLFFPLFILSVGLPFAFYLFSIHIFSDEKRPLGKLKYLFAFLYVVTALLYLITFKHQSQLFLNTAFFLSAFFLIMASYEALSNFSSDLINARRLKRIIAIVTVTVFGVITIYSFYFYEPLSLSPLLIILAAMIQLLSLSIFFPISISYRGVFPLAKAEIKDKSYPKIDNQIDVIENDPILQKVKIEFILTKKYRIEGMTITKLSQLVGEKEYLVRKAINTKMDFSNFNQLLNHLRIEDAKQIIQESDDITMQEIAYTLGYSNPSSFNRAFKHIIGSTPSQYKQSLKS